MRGLDLPQSGRAWARPGCGRRKGPSADDALVNRDLTHFIISSAGKHTTYTSIPTNSNANTPCPSPQVLMEAKRSGEIPGVHGRLGDLGAIDAK